MLKRYGTKALEEKRRTATMNLRRGMITTAQRFGAHHPRRRHSSRTRHRPFRCTDHLQSHSTAVSIVANFAIGRPLPSPGFILDNRFFREYRVMDGRERAGEGPCRHRRSQAVLGLLALATMSVIWDNPENIYSVRVLLPMTPSRHGALCAGPFGSGLPACRARPIAADHAAAVGSAADRRAGHLARFLGRRDGLLVTFASTPRAQP